MVDAFRAMKSCEGSMAFSCVDGETGELIDILPNRQIKFLEKHFLHYSLEARKNVKYLVTDMNAPYFKLARELFPNAAVVVDRFHIVQHINRFFNQTRIRIMKSLDKKHPLSKRFYNQLKSLWKLLLKDRDKLDYKNHFPRRNFKWSALTEVEVVDRIVNISNELHQSYHYFQDLLHEFRAGNSEEFYDILWSMPRNLPEELQHIKKAFFKYEKGIRLAMELPYSNGKIENKNTHIKTLKRVSYGFRNFQNMRTRIYLINGVISIS